VGGKKPGFLRLAPCACTARHLEDVLFENSFRNRVSRRTVENRVSGETVVDAGATLRSTPISSHDPVAETRFLRNVHQLDIPALPPHDYGTIRELPPLVERPSL